MDWYLAVLKNYAGFGGRARRKEYWMFQLFNIIAVIVLEIADRLLSTNGVLTLIYLLAVLVPSIALVVRRLHDTGRSGWWVLIGVVPFVGGLVLLVFTLLEGHPGENEFGPNPKQNAVQA
ncbi:DUF805 domain-containing protein [Kitasatospora sp. NPDC002227]|uniref:DUF805 domain-containing protein n=1 Tax=Kitasatospora sp. NPDC002227 TaxID=3154773 RepID=UPI00332E0D71